MSRKKILHVVIGTTALLSLLGIMTFAAIVGDLNFTHRGATEGFELNGTYAKYTTGIQEERHENQDGSMYVKEEVYENVDGSSYISFADAFDDEKGTTLKDELVWELDYEQEIKDRGTIEKTIDPNFYILLNADGQEIGWVHLAYLSRSAEGSLFVKYAALDMFEMKKISRAARTSTSSEYGKNQQDLIFGSVSETQEPFAEPDLIKVLATNGKEGYVHKTDLDEADGTSLTTMKQVEEAMDVRIEEGSKELSESLNKRFEGDIEISVSEAKDLITLVDDGKLIKAARGLLMLAEDKNMTIIEGFGIDATTKSLSPNQELKESAYEDILMEALAEASLVTSISIPVYEVDGVTVIGEFLVGRL